MLENIMLFAQAPAGGQASSSGNIISLIGPIAIFAFIIFFLFRSQKKQMRERQNMLDSVKAGDKVVTAGGIHGVIVTVKENTFIVKIADNVKVEVSKSGVNSVEHENNGKETDSKNLPDSNKDSKKQ